MVSPSAIANIGAVIGYLMYLSVIPGLVSAWRKGSVAEVSHTFLLLANLCPFCWFFMAIRTENDDILFPNAVNFIVSMVYLMIYHMVKGDFLSFELKYGVFYGSFFLL